MADINAQHAEHFWEGTSDMHQSGNTTFPLFITCQIWRQVQSWFSTQKLDTLRTGPDIRQLRLVKYTHDIRTTYLSMKLIT